MMLRSRRWILLLKCVQGKRLLTVLPRSEGITLVETLTNERDSRTCRLMDSIEISEPVVHSKQRCRDERCFGVRAKASHDRVREVCTSGEVPLRH